MSADFTDLGTLKKNPYFLGVICQKSCIFCIRSLIYLKWYAGSKSRHPDGGIEGTVSSDCRISFCQLSGWNGKNNNLMYRLICRKNIQHDL